METDLNPDEKRKMNMALGLMFLTMFIDLVGFGIILPLLPLYAKQFGADGLTVGMLLTSYSLMQFFFAPMWGRLSDKIGRRPVLMISLATSAVGYTIWGFSNTLAMLFVSRLVAGFGNANLAVAQAYIADVTPEEYRSRGMGMIGAAFGLGFVLGPAIAGTAIVCGVQPHVLGFIAAGFSIIDLIFTAIFLPEPPNRQDNALTPFSLGAGFYFRTLANKKFGLSLLIMFISTFAFANMETTLVLLTNKFYNFSLLQNSCLFTGLGLIMALIQGGLIRRIGKKYPDAVLVTAGTALLTVGLLLIPATHYLPVLGVGLILLATGSGINNPSNSSLLSKLCPREETGGVMGIGQSMATLGRILGPVAGGYLFDAMGAGCPYWVAAACTLLACLLSLKLPRFAKRA
ncbi:MAG: MFS transporter [Cyanobacteria bacterium REEB67]|nr:MFS transporter [Cyanobacteria bacterium REEB67]